MYIYDMQDVGQLVYVKRLSVQSIEALGSHIEWYGTTAYYKKLVT